MKITKDTLKRVIKEEYERMQKEVRYGGAYDSSGEYTGDPYMDGDDEELGNLQRRLMALIKELDAAGMGDKLGFAKKFVQDPRDYSGPAAEADLADMISYLSSLKRR